MWGGGADTFVRLLGLGLVVDGIQQPDVLVLQGAGEVVGAVSQDGVQPLVPLSALPVGAAAVVVVFDLLVVLLQLLQLLPDLLAAPVDVQLGQPRRNAGVDLVVPRGSAQLLLDALLREQTQQGLNLIVAPPVRDFLVHLVPELIILAALPLQELLPGTFLGVPRIAPPPP